MKTQKKYLKKTHHFLLRAWERGYYHSTIEKLISKMQAVEIKTFYLISRKKLQELQITKIKSAYLVIVVKEDCLITLFEQDNLWEFMQSNYKYQFKTIK